MPTSLQKSTATYPSGIVAFTRRRLCESRSVPRHRARQALAGRVHLTNPGGTISRQIIAARIPPARCQSGTTRHRKLGVGGPGNDSTSEPLQDLAGEGAAAHQVLGVEHQAGVLRDCGRVEFDVIDEHHDEVGVGQPFGIATLGLSQGVDLCDVGGRASELSQVFETLS